MRVDGPPEPIEHPTLGPELKYKLQNQLLICIIMYMEDDLEGHHHEVDEMKDKGGDNPYADFILYSNNDAFSKAFAAWFDGFRNGTRRDSEGRKYTAATFEEDYLGQPEKVLAEIVSPMTVEDYLRKLVSLFKVEPSAEVPRTSAVVEIQQVEGIADKAHRDVETIFPDSEKKSA